MAKANFQAIALVVGLIAFSFLFVWYIFAFTEPTSAPPTGNVPAPINVGVTDQSKEGKLGIGTPTLPSVALDVTGGGWIRGSFRTDLDTFLAVTGGNVGIGITGPVIKLAIGDTDTGLQWISDGNLAVFTQNTQRVIFNSQGKVGIDIPLAQLEGDWDQLQVNGSILIRTNKLSGGGGPALHVWNTDNNFFWQWEHMPPSAPGANDGKFAIREAEGGVITTRATISKFGDIWTQGEMSIGGINGDGTGKVVCIKSDGNLGTCADSVSATGTCTCQ